MMLGMYTTTYQHDGQMNAMVTYVKIVAGKLSNSIENSKGTVHITEGNGGVDKCGWQQFFKGVCVERCRMVSSPWNWGAHMGA